MASTLLCSARASFSSVMVSSTKATTSFWFSRSFMSASMLTESSDTLPMMIRQAIMTVTEAKDMNPCFVMLRKPSRIR